MVFIASIVTSQSVPNLLSAGVCFHQSILGSEM